jgi:hypothetical protein
MGTEGGGEVCAKYNTRSTKGEKTYHGTIMDMISASSLVLSSTSSWRYPVGIKANGFFYKNSEQMKGIIIMGNAMAGIASPELSAEKFTRARVARPRDRSRNLHWRCDRR